jgi:hypothetical protein
MFSSVLLKFKTKTDILYSCINLVQALSKLMLRAVLPDSEIDMLCLNRVVSIKV